MQEDGVATISKERLVVAIALIVTTVWAILALVSIATGDYTALTAVTPVMLIVCGFLFGYRGGANGTRAHG